MPKAANNGGDSRQNPLIVRLYAACEEAVTIALAPEEQLTLWTVLSAPVELTLAQEKLGKLMRGEQ